MTITFGACGHPLSAWYGYRRMAADGKGYFECRVCWIKQKKGKSDVWYTADLPSPAELAADILGDV